jgi:hypothetical protein
VKELTCVSEQISVTTENRMFLVTICAKLLTTSETS